TNAWTSVNSTTAPAARAFHRAVWTGTRMIVWGGENSSSVAINTGSRYDPSTDSWSATSNTTVPTARFLFTAVWTGSQMIVWGGEKDFTGTNVVNTGGRYDSSTNSWTSTTTSGAPTARASHTAVWTGSLMIIWGGGATMSVNNGGR